jgi:hypothetical protein
MLPAYVFIFLVPVLYGGSLAFANLAGWNFYLVLWGTVLLVALYTIIRATWPMQSPISAGKTPSCSLWQLTCMTDSLWRSCVRTLNQFSRVY